MKTYWSLMISVITAIAMITSASAREQTQPRTVTLAYVNDIHAQLEPHPELFWESGKEEYIEGVGGLGRLATAVAELKEERDGRVLFLDGGDTLQGSGPAAWSQGAVVVEPMNSIGLDVGVPGNWAVVYGPEVLKARVAEFTYPWIAANVFEESTGHPLFEPYFIKEIDGLKLGVLGYTDPDIPTRQPPFMSEGLDFRGTEVLQPWIDHLRQSEQVDVVILSTHIGLPKSIRLAEQLRGVDVLLSADTHERTYEPIVVGETWVVEAGAFASFLGVLDLTVWPDGRTEKAWSLRELRPELYPEDPAVKAVVDAALAPHRQRMNRVLGHSEVWLSRYDVLNTPLDRLIADAVRSFTGTDIALSNGFRFSPPSAPGPITEADLWNWLPVELPLRTGQVKGQRLTEFWEREFENVFSTDPERLFGGWLPRPSNMSVVFNPRSEPEERLDSLLIGERAVESERVYSISAAARPGSPEHLVHRVRQCVQTRILEATTHQALRAYLAESSPLRDTGAPRIELLDGPDVLRSQALGR